MAADHSSVRNFFLVPCMYIVTCFLSYFLIQESEDVGLVDAAGNQVFISIVLCASRNATFVTEKYRPRCGMLVFGVFLFCQRNQSKYAHGRLSCKP